MSKVPFNKKLSTALIGAAVLAAFSGSALASDNKPTLYGLAHVTLENRDYEGASSSSTVEDKWVLSSNNSRLGVRGALNLNENGSLQAIYQAEYGITVDSRASNPFSQRNIFVGLKGNFGQVTAGHNDTPFKTAGGRIELFSDLPADLGAVIIGGENRVDNLITYNSPKFSNFQVNVAFAPGEGRETADHTAAEPDLEDGIADSYSASIVFDNQTFYAALAYDGNQPATRSFDGLTGTPAGAGQQRVNALLAVGKVTINGFEVGALVQQSQGANDINEDNKDTSFAVNAAYTFNKFRFKIQYAESEGEISETKATLLGLGAEYAFHKQTTAHVFAALGTRENTVAAPAVDVQDKSFGVGLIHRF